VCTENLNPHVMVMKSAEDWVRFDISSPLSRGRETGASLFNDRCVLISL
jgi:hypothetical protein